MLQAEKKELLKKASEKIRELNDLRQQYEFSEISAGTYAEMATSKLKKANALLDSYRQGVGVYWD